LATTNRGGSPVTDANGNQLTVHEIWELTGAFGWIAERHFRLCAGEAVEPLCENSFIVVRTGQALTRLL
jgi:hypothetical protein